MINATIKLPVFDTRFNKDIKREIKQFLSVVIPKSMPTIKQRVGNVVKKSIKESNAYRDLASNTKFHGEIGLPDIASFDAIIDKWASNVYVDFKYSAGKFGKLVIGIIRDDYSDVLSMSEASYVYASETGNGVIDWLRWLLFEGTSIIITDYVFKTSHLGRTGLGIMVEQSGGFWRVPNRYAGTVDDNFVTSSLSRIRKDIDLIVRQEITKAISNG